jgi:DNA-binding SARP family transcriptional activator
MASHRLDFGLLGPLEVRRDGESLALGGTQRRALLAILLLNANHVVSVDRLIDDLWGERPPQTAGHTIQVYVSQLRKLFGPAGEALATQRPGYVLRLEPEQLDLNRLEELLREGREALAAGNAEGAAEKLHEALGLWRGPALADFSFEPFAEAAIARLEDLRLAALEDRIEADLLLGRHQAVIGELEELISANPLRERPRAHLMLALYRAGRQAEALEAYQATRRMLVDELGIEPGARLQELERAILNQDPALDHAPPAETPPAPERSILLVSRNERELDDLLTLTEPLARSQSPHELILARVVAEATELEGAAAELAGARARLGERGIATRVAAFTSSDPAGDIVRLASQQEVDLVLRGEASPDDALRTMLEEAPSDVGILAGTGSGSNETGAVIVPFGAAEHDWAALELGVWLSAARGAPLRLLGTTADPAGGKRDASRILATASLVVQQLAGVVAEPVLVPAGTQGILDAAKDAFVLLLGLSERWRQEGIGTVRSEIVARSAVPVVLVRRGPRPGALSPREGLTRYTWSLAPPEGAPS